MKLTTFFLLITFITVNASVYSQVTKLDLKVQSVTVKEVLIRIEDQSQFFFMYNDRKIDVERKVDLDLKQAKIEDLLKTIFEGTNTKFIIKDRQIVLYNESDEEFRILNTESSTQQQKSVSGKVTDASGASLPGVSVVIKGTTTGVITDTDGKYNLAKVPENGVLRFSFVGMKTQEITVGSKTAINVTLTEETIGIDEVVAIGYGTMKKSDLTGSVSSVKANDLAAIPQASVAQALQGRTAGVHVKQNSGAPGATTTVRIRGTNSILGGNDPLYVIDGFPSNIGIGMLNVEDIESMEVLKDASAIAIYGSRGSNGVIMVTTKKGKTGKTKVDFGTTLGFQSLAKKMEMMNAREYATFYNIRAQNDGRAPFFTQDEINSLGEGFDWQDFVFTTAPIRTHSLTVSGGNEKTKFALSGNIFDQKGIVGKGAYTRYSFRINLDHEISKKMTVNSTTTLSRSVTDNKDSSGGRQGGSLISVALVGPPILTPYNDDGTYRVLDNSYPFITTGGALINPLNILNEVSDVTNRNRVLSNLSFTYEPIDGLFIKILGGIESSDARNDYYRTTKYYNSTGYASVSTTQEISLLNENTVSYVKTFAKKHHLSAVAGFTYQDYITKNLGASGTGFLSDLTETGNIGSATTAGIPSSGYSKWVLLSSIARVNYNFDSRYLFTFSFRADGSSRYSEGDKWGYFPSGSMAWRISEEQFMKKVSLISDLKLRASYGVSGSQAISAYSTLNNLSSGQTVFGNKLFTYFIPAATLPGKLKWEKTDQLDLGVDIGIMDNKFRFTADYYIKQTRDLLNTIQLPSSSGYASTLGNIGQIQNKGLEFSFDAHVINGEFQWLLNGNISFNKSMVRKLYGGQDILGGSIDFMVINDNCNLLREGEPIGIFYGYLKDGYDANGMEKYKDLEPDGIINQMDKTKIGDPNPNFIYGLNSNMSYKGFELSLFIQGSQGNDLINASSVDNSLYYMYGLNQVREVLYDHWTPENPNAKYPKPVTGLSMRLSDRLVENGSYLRLKNVELAYNFPVKKWNASWFEKVRLYVSLQNMFTFTKYSGWDPDVNSQGGGLGQGIDQNPYPVSKSYTFGINATF
ncbi:MAG: TonB-dependent receptor [Prolixibacteraceae bacterium]